MNCSICSEFVRGAMVWAFLVIASASFAQDHSIADAKGTQQHRDYFSQLPFEQVDTATGALVLTFTDLVLPGARGRDLKFQRIYNSKDDKWRFAIAGYPLYIRDPGFAPPGVDMQLIEWAFTPIIFGHDGAAHRTYPRDSVDTNQPTTMNIVMTLDFWRYNRGSAQLRLPDGTICNYEAVPGSAVEKRLKQCWAPFLVEVSQPELFIDWDAGTVSNLHKMPVERTVTVAGLRHEGVPQSVSFQGRTWTYEWGTTSRFLPPQGTGPGWEIEATPYFDSAERTLTVKTPHGGKIAYVFQNQHFPQFDNDYDDHHSRDSHSEVLTERRLFDRGHTEPQRWYYTYGNQNPDGSTTIQTPEDVRILYRHEGNGEDPPRVTEREVAVYENNEWRLLERESRTYTQVPVIHFLPGSGPSAIYKSDYVLASRIVWRDERQYSTYYEYRSAPSAPDDVGGWVGDYHQPWRITENGVGLTGATARVSVREYRHADTVGSVLNVGHLAKETVTVGTESFVKEWDVNPGTGTVSSQTVHGVTTTFSSFFFGQPLSVRDANNRTTTLEYTHGLVSRVGSPEHAVSRVIDADGTLRAETRGAGTVNALTTRYEYDPAFRPTTITPPQAAGGRHETRIEYDPAGTWVRTTRGTSVVTTVLDGFGRPVETITSEGVSTRSRYDTEGRKVFEGYPIPVGAPDMGTAIAYDGLNRMTRRTHPDSAFVTYTYGPGTVTIVDEKQRTTVPPHRGLRKSRRNPPRQSR
jgi:hypothetical protein